MPKKFRIPKGMSGLRLPGGVKLPASLTTVHANGGVVWGSRVNPPSARVPKVSIPTSASGASPPIVTTSTSGGKQPRTRLGAKAQRTMEGLVEKKKAGTITEKEAAHLARIRTRRQGYNQAQPATPATPSARPQSGSGGKNKPKPSPRGGNAERRAARQAARSQGSSSSTSTSTSSGGGRQRTQRTQRTRPRPNQRRATPATPAAPAASDAPRIRAGRGKKTRARRRGTNRTS